MDLRYLEKYLFNSCVDVFNFCMNPRHFVSDTKTLIGSNCISQVRKESPRKIFLVPWNRQGQS